MAERRLAFAVPGDIETRTGGTIYDKRVIEALRAQGWQVDLLTWPATFPFPSDADLAAVTASLAALPENALVLIDGLAFGAMPKIAAKQTKRLRLAALVHHPLALETGLSAAEARTLMASERQALTHARIIVTSSKMTADILERHYGRPAYRIFPVHPGVDPAPPKPPRQPGSPRILALGTVTPRKAHLVLVEALGRIVDLDWQATLAGSLTRDPACAEALRRRVADLGLSDRITLAGEIADVEAVRLYGQADIFALASVYEGYGMVFSEALTHGLPIVATTGGAIPEAVPAEAGLLVPPGDAEAFAEALGQLVGDPARRAKMAAAAARIGKSLAGWEETAQRIGTVLARL